MSGTARADRAGLAGVSWMARVRHRACSVRLISPFKPEEVELRTHQARGLRRIAAPWTAAGDVVVLAGDVNAEPRRQTMKHLHLHRERGDGAFRASSGRASSRASSRDCRCARSTHDDRSVKIDDVFFSANRTAGPARGGLRVISTASEHHLLVEGAFADVSRP